MKQYPAYRDSGIEWIGEIPDHWDIQKLKYIASVKSSNVDKKSFEDEQSVRLCNYLDVYNNEFITSDMNFMEATATSEEIDKFILRKHDTLITKDSEDWEDIAVPAYVLSDIQGVLCGYHLAQIRPNEAFLRGGYLFRSFCAANLNEQFKVAANGITRFGIGKYYIDNALFLVPATEEQQAIADYLDAKTALIDELIDKKQRQIELLKEQRQAVINQAVTKGLDPNVEMKDSGIEWLGEIPKHWEKCKLKHLVCIKITDGPHETPEFVDDGIPFVSAEAIKEDSNIDFNSKRGYISNELHLEYCRKCKPVRNDIFMVKSGATTGRIGMVEVDFEFSIWSPLALIRSDSSKVLPRLMFYSLQSDGFQDGVRLSWSFGTQQNIGMGVIENLFVVVPPIEEQPTLIEFIEKELLKIGSSIHKAEKQIQLLQEYRTALISEVVTGKIDVR